MSAIEYLTILQADVGPPAELGQLGREGWTLAGAPTWSNTGRWVIFYFWRPLERAPIGAAELERSEFEQIKRENATLKRRLQIALHQPDWETSRAVIANTLLEFHALEATEPAAPGATIAAGGLNDLGQPKDPTTWPAMQPRT